LILLAEGLPRRKKVGQPGARKGLENQPALWIAPQSGLIAGQFEFAGDPEGLATAVLEEADVAD
jgi:hypothetical protein